MPPAVEPSAARVTTQRAWVCKTVSPTFEAGLALCATAPRPRPAPEQSLGPEEILVRVAYAALNPAEYKIPQLGDLATRALYGLPFVPGQDFAGTVIGRGERVRDLALGTPVFGRLAWPPRSGALGEYVVAAPDFWAPLPTGVPAAAAVRLPCSGLKAYAALATAQPGDAVFINGGSGAIGSLAIQIAKALGCGRVVVTCSGANESLCRRLGADDVIDYRQEDVCARLGAMGPVFALVVDNVGDSPADLYQAADAFLKPTEVFVQIGAAVTLAGVAGVAARALTPGFLGNGYRRSVTPFAACTRADLDKLAGWVRDSKLEAIVDEVLPFTDVPKGYSMLRGGGRTGKIVVKVHSTD